MQQNRDPVIEDGRVKGFADREATNKWLLQNPERAVAGIHFEVWNATSIDFTLQVNTTGRSFRGEAQDPILDSALPLQVAAQREIARWVASAHWGWHTRSCARLLLHWHAYPWLWGVQRSRHVLSGHSSGIEQHCQGVTHKPR